MEAGVRRIRLGEQKAAASAHNNLHDFMFWRIRINPAGIFSVKVWVIIYLTLKLNTAGRKPKGNV